MNCTVNFVRIFASSLCMPWQHGTRQQGWCIRGTLIKQFPQYSLFCLLVVDDTSDWMRHPPPPPRRRPLRPSLLLSPLRHVPRLISITHFRFSDMPAYSMRPRNIERPAGLGSVLVRCASSKIYLATFVWDKVYNISSSLNETSSSSSFATAISVLALVPAVALSRRSK